MSMIVLASASPRRRDLLWQIKVPHVVHPAHIDEQVLQGESATAYVQRLASEKAHAVETIYKEACILAADTTVVIDGQILNKPGDPEEAEMMLRSLSGRTHHVHTGVCVLCSSQELAHVETTSVTFGRIPDSELKAYVESGDPFDKAGAYGIQGYAARWVSGISGDFFNVVGLPLSAVCGLLRQVVGI